MATTLRNFQSEIEQIHNREFAKQKVNGAEQLQKEQKHSQVKGKAKEEAVIELAKAGTEELRDEAEAEEKILVRYQYLRIYSISTVPTIIIGTVIKQSIS